MDQFFEDQKNQNESRLSDEISLRYILKKMGYWWSILWPKKSFIIGLSMLIGATSVLYAKYIKLPTYIASYKLFFEEKGGGMTSAMRLASSFGLSLGGGSTTSSASVQEYLTSRDNISKVILAPRESGRLIDRFYATKLDEDEEFSKSYYSKLGLDRRFTDSVLTDVTRLLNEERYLEVSINEKTGLTLFKVQGSNESFVFDLSTSLIKNTELVFLNWKKQKSQSAVDAFQLKVDSINLALNSIFRRLGEYEDQNNLLVSSVDKMERMRLTVEMEALKVSYGEYIKGLEMSKAERINLEPPFKYFDAPTYPLSQEKLSATKLGVLSSVISGFFLIFFYISRVELKNILS